MLSRGNNLNICNSGKPSLEIREHLLGVCFWEWNPKLEWMQCHSWGGRSYCPSLATFLETPEGESLLRIGGVAWTHSRSGESSPRALAKLSISDLLLPFPATSSHRAPVPFWTFPIFLRGNCPHLPGKETGKPSSTSSRCVPPVFL